MCKSIRSMMGPDNFLLYLAICPGVQVQTFSASVELPQGQGFIAATKMNLAGYVMLPWAREIETSPSSSG